MRTLLLPLLLTLPATAQDPVDLDLLRETFNESASAVPRVVIAIVPGQPPVILCSGKHDDDTPASERSLVPLGLFARDLVGDALHVSRKGKLDAEGLTIGDRKATLLQLIRGSDLLPDLEYWRTGGYQPDTAEIRKCAEVAAAANVQLLNMRGWADLLFLEPHLRQGRFPDICTALRGTLAPHVPALDPLDARTLSKKMRELLIGNPRNDFDVADPGPQFARLVMPAKTVAAWWQWRMSSGLPLWTGPRAGSMGTVPGEDDIKRWSRWSQEPRQVTVFAYPSRKAALVVCANFRENTTLLEAFEECLFGPQVAEPEEISFEFDDVTNITQDFQALGTGEWSRVANGTRTAVVVRDQKIVFRHGDLELVFPMAFRTKNKRAWDLAPVTLDSRTSHRVVLLVDEDGKKLRAVWTCHNNDTCLARHFELAPESKD